MAEYRLHVGDKGTILRATLKNFDGAIEPIDDATTQELLFERPDGTGFARVSGFYVAGLDGKFQYITDTLDIDMEGRWRFEGHLAGPGYDFHTTKYEILVDAPIVVT